MESAIQFDDDAEEHTEDLRFSRLSSNEAFGESVPGLTWTCYPGVATLAGILGRLCLNAPDMAMTVHLIRYNSILS